MWNVQGIDMSLSRLKKLVKKFKVTMVGIIELFHTKDDIQRFATSLASPKYYTNEGWGGKI